MKVVILSSRFPFPLEKGDKLRLYYQMKDLANHHELHLISLHEEDISQSSLEKIREICASVLLQKLPKKSAIIRAGRGLLNGKPFQVNYFYSGKIAKNISARIDEIAPDVIYCQLVRMAEYAKFLNYPKVLDYMDCFSMNYSKRQGFEKFPVSNFFNIESKRLARYEKSIAKDFNLLTIISKRDLEQINVQREVEVITNGIDTDFFHMPQSEKNCDLLFVGNMGYHPNILAAKYLVESLLPVMARKVSVKIAGARPNASVKALESEHVEVTGWVDDIRQCYAKARIFVAPIFTGAGQQNKILEAMSMGMICITTSTVNEAIGATDHKELLIANNVAEFANLIEKVLDNIDQYKSIKSNARTFVKENFSWSAENKKLNDIIIKAGKEK